jgi:hypothetical protein
MTIIVRCIYRKAVNPSCNILVLDHDEFRTFLNVNQQERKRIVLLKLNKSYLLGAVREIAWIPYDDQNVVVINNENGIDLESKVN